MLSQENVLNKCIKKSIITKEVHLLLGLLDTACHRHNLKASSMNIKIPAELFRCCHDKRWFNVNSQCHCSNRVK